MRTIEKSKTKVYNYRYYNHKKDAYFDMYPFEHLRYEYTYTKYIDHVHLSISILNDCNRHEIGYLTARSKNGKLYVHCINKQKQYIYNSAMIKRLFFAYKLRDAILLRKAIHNIASKNIIYL